MVTKETPKQPSNGQSEQDTQFSIQKVYIKDISFETPSTPEIFRIEWKPVVDMHISNETTLLDDDLFEVVLSVTLTVKIGDKVAYLAEINQAGVFFIKNIPEEAMSRMLATVCANILFPFMREAISDLVTRGGFPQLLLAPVNFEALYIQQQEATQFKSETTH